MSSFRVRKPSARDLAIANHTLPNIGEFEAGTQGSWTKNTHFCEVRPLSGWGTRARTGG
jgi:hypothetical protein